MQLLSGKEVREAWVPRLQNEAKTLAATGFRPTLGMILVGEHAPSQTYVAAKAKFAERLGLHSLRQNLPANISQQALEATIRAWNDDPTVHGILCQMPLPAHLDENAISCCIAPQKDVDCFHPTNFGLLAQGRPHFLPCTPAGVLAILDHYTISTQGKQVAVIGRSNIVGRPMSLLLSLPERNSTVTVCHSKTQNLSRITRQADILVAAIGRPASIDETYIKTGAAVIDVGISRVEDLTAPKGYRIVGDVDFEVVKNVASAITPVPGGAGLMTVAMLMQNTLTACRMLSKTNA